MHFHDMPLSSKSFHHRVCANFQSLHLDFVVALLEASTLVGLSAFGGYAEARRISGWFFAICRSFSAGPDGCRRFFSQLRIVTGVTFR